MHSLFAMQSKHGGSIQSVAAFRRSGQRRTASHRSVSCECILPHGGSGLIAGFIRGDRLIQRRGGKPGAILADRRQAHRIPSGHAAFGRGVEARALTTAIPRPVVRDKNSARWAIAKPAPTGENRGGSGNLNRGGSVCLNRFRVFSKWTSASVMPLPLRASAG